MTPQINDKVIRLGLPKGRMQDGVFKLLEDAGIRLSRGERAYRPKISLPDFEVKILKPQTIIEMLCTGSRDLGFAGSDWVKEFNVELVEILDTTLDPVRLVAAAPREFLDNGKLPNRPLIIASEYEQITKEWIQAQKLNATFVLSYGATEVFPPEDADCIVDNTATGSTLEANNLEIIADLMKSSTKLYASPQAMKDPNKRQKIEDFALLINSVIEARSRVMIEVNVSSENLDAVAEVLPAMKQPTISELRSGAGFVVKAAVPNKMLATLIPAIKQRGGTDIVVTKIAQIVP